MFLLAASPRAKLSKVSVPGLTARLVFGSTGKLQSYALQSANKRIRTVGLVSLLGAVNFVARDRDVLGYGQQVDDFVFGIYVELFDEGQPDQSARYLIKFEPEELLVFKINSHTEIPLLYDRNAAREIPKAAER